ncbi:hypothetical protein RHMOL_Rhmol08G0059100 [Rhododendron molle]|uniref:Uncharacterized protein n=1 Tax=Rhododendron molle TaxID=49168 RepID=A0ACC0MKA8_RHOML|nr:hypothetical protein RHMOL_Rhmol08G0059100 [Rhododendron molle]
MDTILCDELLEEVLRRFPFPPAAAVVSLVSKRWLRLYRSSKRYLLLRISGDSCKPPSLSSFLAHFPHLSYLDITANGGDDVSNFSDQILLSVASSCPKLRTLCLKSEPVSLFPLLSLSTSCPHLTSLSISLSRPISFHWLVFLHSLKKLTVVFTPVPGEFEQVDTYKRNLNAELKLETLVLDGIRRGNYGIRTMALAMSNELEELALVNCNLEPGLLTTLGQKFRNLRTLDLSYNEMVDEEFISMLASCNCLRNVKVRVCEGLTDASLVSMFKSCKQLETVDIMNCPGIGAEAVELFVLNCLQLKVFCVEESKLSDVSRNRAHFDSVIYHPSDTIKFSLDIASQKLETSIRSAMCYTNGEIDSVFESAGNVNVKLPRASFSNTAICANEGRVRIVGDGAWQKESLKVAAAWVAFDEANQEIGCIKIVLFCPVVDNIGN